jgi:hypothetical protein
MDHVRAAIRDRYSTVLSEVLGWPNEADAEGNLRFERDGTVFFIDNFGAEDPEYLRLHHWLKLDEAILALDLHAIASDVTYKVKGTKIVVRDDCVIAAAEYPVGGPDCLPSVQALAERLPRSVRMVRHGMCEFVTAVTLAGIEVATAEASAEWPDQS